MGRLNNVVAAVWRAGHAVSGVGSRGRPQASDNQLKPVSDVSDLAEAIALALNGGPSKAGVPVTVDTARRVAAVASCVRVITDTLAQLPIGLFRRDDDRRMPLADDPLHRLVHDRPNEWQTAFEFVELMQGDALYRGNAYALISRDSRGRPQELIRLHPDRVEPRQDDALTVTYRLTGAAGRREILRRDQVLHIRGPGDDGLKGLNPVQQFRESIGDAIATQGYGSRFFSNGARPSGLLEMSEGVKVGEEAQKALREDFESMYGGGENAHKTAFLPFGMKFNPVSISNEDAQFLETRKFQISDIARIFRVPPHMIGDLERATFSNIEHQAIEFTVHTMAPWFRRWEQALGRDLLPADDDRYFKFNSNALLRGDFKTRQEGLNIQRRAGVINADEWRAQEDMNPRGDEGGKEYIVERNMREQDGTPPPEDGGRGNDGGTR